MGNKNMWGVLCREIMELGAYKANVISTSRIITDRSFRDMCAQNSCGLFGNCHMCPPDVGEIDKLMNEIKSYDYALVYQTVSELEDSLDFEGMMEAKKQMFRLSQEIRKYIEKTENIRVLHLGAGGCGVCKICAKRENKSCRHPETAMPSLEAYGVNVSELSRAAEMKYTNGQNTVTYFGAVLFSVAGGRV